MCKYTVCSQKGSCSEVQLQDLIAQPYRAVAADFAFEGCLRAFPEGQRLGDFSISASGQLDVEGTATVRALGNYQPRSLEWLQGPDQDRPRHAEQIRQFSNLQSPMPGQERVSR